MMNPVDPDRSLLLQYIRADGWFLGVLCAIQMVLVTGIALTSSPTFLEPAHLSAGISHWKLGRFELFRVNPPLVRAVAALPALCMSPQTDWEMFYEHPGARSEFPVGRAFFQKNGMRACHMLKVGRIVCLPFVLLGTIVCYLWATELYGRTSGRFVSALWVFTPDILAHGALITPDVGGATLGLAASYAFHRWLRNPHLHNAVPVGMLLGLSCLAKTTCIVLPVLWLTFWVFSLARKTIARSRTSQVGDLALMFTLAIVVVNSGFVWDGVGKPLGDFRFVSTALGGPAAAEPPVYWGNRFTGTWLESVPCPLPEQFVCGLDIQKHDFESLDYPSYMAGELRQGGWATYYLYVWAVKLPVGVLLLAGVWGISLAFRGKEMSLAEWIPIIHLVALFALVSSQTQFSHHGRYALPAYSFLLVALGSVFAWAAKGQLARGGTWILASLAVLSSLSQYPHSLSYFNEMAGGPERGREHLIDSNLDWGQDLDRLREWCADQKLAEPINLCLYTHVDPEDQGLAYQSELEQPFAGAPSMLAVRPGIYAVSMSMLQGAPHSISNGNHQYTLLPVYGCSWLQNFEAEARIGGSLLIYRIGSRDIDKAKSSQIQYAKMSMEYHERK